MIEKAEIVRAQVEHASLLSHVGGRLFEETFRGTCSDRDMESQLLQYYNLAQLERELADPGDYFFMILVDGRLQGYSRLKEGQPPAEVLGGQRSVELKRLYMEHDAKGSGLAVKLMLHNLELAKSMGYRRIYLSVWEHNERAKSFYRKMGFVDSGVENPFPIGQTPQTDYWYIQDFPVGSA